MPGVFNRPTSRTVWGNTTMTNKLILAAAITAIAVSFAPTASFAKKMHKEKEAKCGPVGSMCTKKLDKVGKATGWANTKTCYPNHKMYLSAFPCYKSGGMCPAATCKSKK